MIQYDVLLHYITSFTCGVNKCINTIQELKLVRCLNWIKTNDVEIESMMPLWCCIRAV